MKKTLFISDLHLNSQHETSENLFTSLLNGCGKDVDAVYILGDLFEAWIGDDDNDAFNKAIIHTLKSTSHRGIKLYFLRGNRDFLISKRFAKETGCQLLADEEVISLYGERILLMHGDTLCTRDTAYLKWRKKATNPILHTLFFLALPLFIRRKIATKLRDASRKQSNAKPDDIMDVTQQEVERVMQKHHCQTLIHGHTHRANIHEFTLNNQPARRIVLGDWHSKASVLACTEDGRKNLLSLKLDDISKW